MASTVCLYSILGVEKDASQKQIVKAFRLRAIQLHPDKKKPEERESAKNDFQALHAAYEVLGDAEKRHHYDETGIDDLENIVSKWKGYYPPITLDLIRDYEKRYKGSCEEKEDLIQFFVRFNGDVTNLLEYIPFSESHDVKRYISIIKKMIKNKEFPHSRKLEKKFESSQKTLRKNAKLYTRKNKREKRKLESCNVKNDEANLDGLVELIQKNKKNREGNCFLDYLEKKYC